MSQCCLLTVRQRLERPRHRPRGRQVGRVGPYACSVVLEGVLEGLGQVTRLRRHQLRAASRRLPRALAPGNKASTDNAQGRRRHGVAAFHPGLGNSIGNALSLTLVSGSGVTAGPPATSEGNQDGRPGAGHFDSRRSGSDLRLSVSTWKRQVGGVSGPGRKLRTWSMSREVMDRLVGAGSAAAGGHHTNTEGREAQTDVGPVSLLHKCPWSGFGGLSPGQ